MTTARMTLPIGDLGHGGGDASAIARALEGLPGVIRVAVNPLTEMAYVEYDPERATEGAFRTAIDRVGFRVGTARIR